MEAHQNKVEGTISHTELFVQGGEVTQVDIRSCTTSILSLSFAEWKVVCVLTMTFSPVATTVSALVNYARY